MDQRTNRLVYPAEQGFPRNQWYVAAFSHEVGRDPLVRTFLDVPVVLFRTEAGEPVALYDRCPHRGMPLSKGLLKRDNIQCGYHGIEFGPDGGCRKIPQQELIPPGMCVASYPLVERWQWIWIWMGDRDKADPALLPDHDWLGVERPGYCATPFFMMEMQANYQYMHDNLMDTSHLTYLHPGLLDTGEMAGSSFSVHEDGQLLRLIRKIPNLRFDEPVASYFRVRTDRSYDRVLSTETFVPSVSIARQTLRDREDEAAAEIELSAINALTPAGRNRTYVFQVQVSSYPHGSEQDHAGVRLILDQDRIASEAMQARYDAFGDTAEMSIASDHMGIRSRRLITRLLREETEGAA